MDYELTKKELANIAGYTYRRLYDIDQGLPEDKKLFVRSNDSSNKYDLQMFVKRWVDYNVSRDVGNIVDLDEIKAKHETIKAEKTQLEVDRMKGRLVDVFDVKKLWGNVANTVMQNLIRLPHKLAPMLKMMDNTEEIAFIIDDEIRKVLNEIADTPLPEDANDNSEENDKEEGEE